LFESKISSLSITNTNGSNNVLFNRTSAKKFIVISRFSSPKVQRDSPI